MLNCQTSFMFSSSLKVMNLHSFVSRLFQDVPGYFGLGTTIPVAKDECVDLSDTGAVVGKLFVLVMLHVE